MVKVTIESGDEVRILEGQCTMVYVKGQEEFREQANIALVGRHEEPAELLMKIARAVGVLTKEFYDNPFERLFATRKAAIALVDATDNEDITVRERDRKTERIEE